MVSVAQIQSWSGGRFIMQQGNSDIEELVIDTRKIVNPELAIFVALHTERRDGHSFIADAYEKGIRNFLVHQEINTQHYPATNFILVKDTLVALQQIVASFRKQFTIPVIGITGSNGKTIVKEWLAQLLSKDFHLLKSPRSFNSQVGVPLSVANLTPEHELGIFEAGISQTDEMDKLEKIIQPTMGVFTNIGEAHSEGFLNNRQKVNEKLKLFRHVKQLVFCSDHPEVSEAIHLFRQQLSQEEKEEMKLFTWSAKQDANLRILKTEQQNKGTLIEANYQEEEISIFIPFTDAASIENAIHCWCVAILLGLDVQDIKDGMANLHAVAMRLELRQGINDCTIINDTYNSDLTSLLIALDFLEQQNQHSVHTVVMSDMFQIGKSDAELYEDVAALILKRNVQRFIGVGPALFKYKDFYKDQKKLKTFFFKSTEDLLKKIHLINFNNEAVLLKGARAFQFEKVDMLLEQKLHQTVLSINLSSLTHNLNTFRTKLKPGVKTMAMVKAFSYGSGSYEIANLLQYSGVDYLSVAYTDEGVVLRKAGITMPIMVMSPDASAFDRMIAWKLEPEIFSTHSLQSFIEMANTLQVKDYPIHVKLDTGMHRLGFILQEVEALTQTIQHTDTIKVASIFSHLAASEDTTLDHFTTEQAQRFEAMSEQIITALNYRPLRHLCNSAAIARHPALHYDMVRIGLGLYGIDGSGILQNKLKQISTLKTTIAQIKQIPVGETVGYGRKGSVDRPTRIATISIGYADGYPRALGNGIGYFLVRSKQAKTVGVVCMDMCMIDITDIPEAKEGDEVIVFSPQLPLTQLASWAGTISYEVMTGISQRVKRIYVNEE